MAEELTFSDEAAARDDQAFAHVTAYFMPFLLRAAGVAPGMRVLDIATGTGLSAEAALAAVGPTGHVTAADISPAMVAKARERLGDASNVAAPRLRPPFAIRMHQATDWGHNRELRC